MNCLYCNELLIKTDPSIINMHWDLYCPSCPIKVKYRVTTNSLTKQKNITDCVMVVTITNNNYYIFANILQLNCYSPLEVYHNGNKIIKLDFLPNITPQTAKQFIQRFINIKAFL